MTEQPNCTTGVHRFERNNYFYGKLLTVRDMAAEQAYHAGMQRTLSRFVTDWGVICGLEVTRKVDVDDDTGQELLMVTVGKGLALDRCGRLLSVAEEQREPVTLPPTADGAETDTISVYVEYDECFTDPVPAAKMENACEEDCKDNRVVEGASVIVEPGDPGDYHKSVADVDFPSAVDLGMADDREAQSLAVEGDLLLVDADSEHESTVSLDMVLSDTAPDGQVEVDISPPQTGDPTTLVGDVEIPTDAFIGADGFVLPDGSFEITGAIGEGDSRASVGGSITATPSGDGVGFTGNITFDSVHDSLDIPFDFSIDLVDGDIELTGELTFPDALIEVDDELAVDDRDDKYGLVGEATVFADEDGEREELGDIETTTWEDDEGAEVSGIQVDKPASRGDTDGEEIDIDAELAGPARSYFENEPRTDCPEAEDGRILVGTITSDDGNWETTSFTQGPLVYTNDLLYDALVNHASDFDNPHDVVASIKGVTPDETGDVDVTSDETISVTRGRNSINLSVAEGVGLPEEYHEYLLETALQCECNAFGDLADRYDLRLAGSIARTLENHLAAWQSGEADYLDVFEGEGAVQRREERLHSELTGEQWEFIGGTDRFGAAVGRLVETIANDPTPLTAAIAQKRVCEAASCLRGECITFERFPFQRESLPRPFTYENHVIDSNGRLALIEGEDGMRLVLDEGEVVIDHPITDYLRIELFSESAWDGVFLQLVAIDTDGDEHTIFDGQADTSWDQRHAFTIEEEDLTRLILTQDGETADLTELCRR